MSMKWLAPLFVTLFASAKASYAQSVALEEQQPAPTPNPYLVGCSLGVSFPAGGSPVAQNAVGFRCMASDWFALSVYAQGGYDKPTNKSVMGGALRGDWFFSSATRSIPFVFMQVSGGETKAPKERDKEASVSSAGGALGFGVEVFLISELSVSGEVAAVSNFHPSSKLNFTTLTPALAMHLHF